MIIRNSLKLFSHIHGYFFLQILKFTKYSIKLIEKLSRRHLINSSDVFVIRFTTILWIRETQTFYSLEKFKKDLLIFICLHNLQLSAIGYRMNFKTTFYKFFCCLQTSGLYCNSARVIPKGWDFKKTT